MSSENSPEEIGHVDVFELLIEEGRMSISEITEKLMNSKVDCSECGTPTTEYNKLRGEVRDHLATLMDEGRVGSTPDWNYKVPKRFHE